MADPMCGIVQKRHAEEDVLGDIIIAAAKRRKLTRRVQQQEIYEPEPCDHEDCQSLLSHSLSLLLLTKLNHEDIEFSCMLKYFKLTLRSQGGHALLCPACGGLPDDPRLARCAHVYCDECYSEMVVDASKEAMGSDGFLLCESPGCDENILDALILNDEQ